jgi:hypothetical protein
MPVTWDELAEIAESGESSQLYWLADAALERLEEVGDLFEPVLTLKQSLPAEFLNAVRTNGHTVKARASRRIAASKKASEQGGRRTFALSDERLVLDLSDAWYVWHIEGKMPSRSKQKVTLRMIAQPQKASEPLTDEGTFEIIEGNFEKGYAYVYFSGSRLRGEYTLTRQDQSSEWALAKGFVAWATAETSKARKSRPRT